MNCDNDQCKINKIGSIILSFQVQSPENGSINALGCRWFNKSVRYIYIGNNKLQHSIE